MNKNGISRRKVLAVATASIAGAAISLTGITADASSPSPRIANQNPHHLQDLSKPTGVMVRIELLNPRATPENSFDVLTDASLGKVISLHQDTKIASSYYFDIDVDRRTTTPSDLNFTITLYDKSGKNVGRINIGDRGTAIFKPQQIMFYVSANFS